MTDQQKIIDANDKSVRQILDTKKYSIDVFQREYRWQRKHMEQLIVDLTTKFYACYDESHERPEVRNYNKYYLGPLVLRIKNGVNSIIDGQQRLTSLTLLLIYLNNLQKDSTKKVSIEKLIYSESFSEKSFNLQVDDREQCISSLYDTGDYVQDEMSESVLNIIERYNDIEEIFPDDLKDRALPFFIDWLVEHVIFVEIVTFSDDDAYTIFETMNDRGLNLTSAEMLKGYLLSALDTQKKKIELNELWKKQVQKINDESKNEDLEFFKAWLRAKYADTIRQGKKGSENEDFEKIGTRFHTWVRDNKDKIGLTSSSDFYSFVKENFMFYSKLYLKICDATENLHQNIESIYYLQSRGFSLYAPILMAPIKLNEPEDIIIKKLAIVSRYLEMFIVFRSVNHRTMAHSSIRYTMYNLVKKIRDKSVNELIQILKEDISKFEEDLSGIKSLILNGQNKRFIHFLLARITRHIEEKCGISSSFEDYVDPYLKKPFEVEHIWSDKYDEYKDEFAQQHEWSNYRNNIGALILLQRGFNQSYGSLPYEKKLPHYYGQNLLAKTLNNQCYANNPSFKQFIQETKIPFRAHEHFKKEDVEERNKLYQKICENIYDVNFFDCFIEQ